MAFIEHEIGFVEKVFNVFEPAPALLEVNPLARVPAVQLRDGSWLVDSHSILELFYEDLDGRGRSSPGRTDRSSGDAPALMARKTALQWSGLAVGACEKVVEYFLETQRPKSAQDPEVIAEVTQVVGAALKRMDALASAWPSAGGQWILGGERPSQADIDVACLLDYLSLRHPMNWRSDAPALDRYLRSQWEGRRSYLATLPPPA